MGQDFRVVSVLSFSVKMSVENTDDVLVVKIKEDV